MTLALILHGAALAPAGIASTLGRRDAITAPIPANSSLGLPTQRVPDLASPPRDLQPTLRNDGRRAPAVAIADASRVLRAALPLPARRARSNPQRTRLRPPSDPPH